MIDKRETRDTILGGALTIVQPTNGYRFSLDALLLADFARPRKRDRLLDLGCGCGVIAAMIALIGGPQAVVGIEVQPALADCARRNARANRLETMTVIEADLRHRKIPGVEPDSFDYVIANPPYWPARGGRESPNASRRIARGGDGASLRDFIQAASRFAKGNGRVALVFTALRSIELMVELKANALEPKRIRFVHPYADAAASTVMVEARKGGRSEVQIEPPLIVWARPGVYTSETESILGGRSNEPLSAR